MKFTCFLFLFIISPQFIFLTESYACAKTMVSPSPEVSEPESLIMQIPAHENSCLTSTEVVEKSLVSDESDSTSELLQLPDSANYEIVETYTGSRNHPRRMVLDTPVTDNAGHLVLMTYPKALKTCQARFASLPTREEWLAFKLQGRLRGELDPSRPPVHFWSSTVDTVDSNFVYIFSDDPDDENAIFYFHRTRRTAAVRCVFRNMKIPSLVAQ